MDKLKQILASKKPQAKITIQKDQIDKKKEEYLKAEQENQKKKQQNQKKRLLELEDYYTYQDKKKKVKPNQQQSQFTLTDEEVMQKLEELYQKPKLDNESQIGRYKRYLRIKKIHEENSDIDMKTFDEQFYIKMKEKQYFEQLDLKYRARLIEPKLGDHVDFRNKKMEMILAEKDMDLYTKQNFSNVCDEIYLWLKKILRDWKQKLQQKYQAQQVKVKNRASFERYNETALDFRSLFQVLKQKAGDKDMIISIYHIMNCCLVRQFIQAHDKYIELSIGTAPWPMGVAMLGITVKRNALRLSHVLNDQMTRRWIQSLKRVITVSQELYPHQQNLRMVHLSINKIL